MTAIIEVKVPDLGDFKDVPVIEIAVKPGDAVKADDPLVTLESDKATMEVPAPGAGVVKEVRVGIGDRVSEGTLIVLLEETGAGAPTAEVSESPPPAPAAAVSPLPVTPSRVSPPQPQPVAPGGPEAASAQRPAHASPSVRRFARDLGVDVHQVQGSGPKGRILHADVQAFVKAAMANMGGVPATPVAAAASMGGLSVLPWPQVDFAKFGPVELKPLARIRKISAANLARNWVMIPAVTYHEDADITELEAFRIALNHEHEQSGGIKLTLLAFLIKACAAALRKFPEFSSSLDGDNLVLKKYCHIAFAADTPNGLVVPVIRDADQKGVLELAAESGALAKKAREGKLSPAEMSGACFTISSVGGIGGTGFAPIVNAPEVAILGANKSVMKPVWDGKQFVPRLMLPLSLTADHRVIDGAAATRFNAYLAQLLGDMRRVIL